jgi:transposase InsO family protein
LSPEGTLARKVRSDAGFFKSPSRPLKDAIVRFHCQFRRWTHRLHYDNLKVVVAKDPTLGRLPSYATVRRFRKARGLVRMHRPRADARPGELQAARQLDEREVRSFEATHVNALWHTDFHGGSRKILRSSGEWVTPQLVALLDDHSRLVCHAQWYHAETAENFVHAFRQAIQKRGLPRLLLSDNGSPFVAEEVTQGLRRLDVQQETTLPYSPHQNGKQENFWALIEGRLLPLFDACPQITLKQLNDATQAFLDQDYHEKVHSELGVPPLRRFLDGPSVARPGLPTDSLRLAFGIDRSRKVRRSDGTVSIEGARYEIPLRYRHFEQPVVRYARWDLSFVNLIDPTSGLPLCRIFPRDLARNADGERKSLPVDPAVDSAEDAAPAGQAPLLLDLLERARASGLPPAYIPKDEIEEVDE